VASAFVAGVAGRGEPGPYNLAARGTITMTTVANALDWYSVPVPGMVVEAAAEVASRLPFAPASVAWLHSVKKPVLMKTGRAQKQLGWRPKHTAAATLKEMIGAGRSELAAR
jgi:nucleoside-diphosphate-sugar epimerase